MIQDRVGQEQLRELIAMLYVGQVPEFDVEDVRPAGARLKTFGGRASGPEPLVDFYRFCINMFKGAAGRRLYPIECHDIMCKIGEVVVVGGVRRSALISLSNLGDDQMRYAKSGQWWENEGQRALANNSVAYKGKIRWKHSCVNGWHLLKVNQESVVYLIVESAKNKQSKNGRRETDYQFGCNPCSEIILRPYQFCNLSEVVVREDRYRRNSS